MQVKIGSRLLLSAILMMFCVAGFAQQYEVPKAVPPFNMILSDGATYYNASNIDRSKPLMIVYFDPECLHCRNFTKALLKDIKKFSDVQIVFICDAPGIPPVKQFVSDFNLGGYGNIKVGTEGVYRATLNFYHVDITPFIALYNNRQVLIKYYREPPQINVLAVQLKGQAVSS